MKAAADRFVGVSGLIPVFDTDTVVAQEMRCIQDPEVASGADAKNLITPAFKTMVLRMVHLIGEIKMTDPSSTEIFRSGVLNTVVYGVVTCSECHNGTSLAFVTNSIPYSKLCCLVHYTEAREGGERPLLIHLPEDCRSFKAWVGVAEEGG